MSEAARLYVLSGPDAGRSFRLSARTDVGRDSECTVSLRGSSLSRRHARFERTAAGWVVSDLGSTNGVAMDGQRIERAVLADHDELALGDVRLRFRLDVAGGPAPDPVSGTETGSMGARDRTPQRAGLLGGDLGQRPVWMRAIWILFALGLAAGLFWLSFRLAQRVG